MGDGRKVLIVDDEPDVIAFLSAWLEDQGFTTVTALDGQQGMTVVADQRPDLILMDLEMPERTGVQLFRDLRRDEALSAIPVIFITGSSQAPLFGHGCASLDSPVARIAKPIDQDLLRAAIHQAFEAPPAPARTKAPG